MPDLRIAVVFANC